MSVSESIERKLRERFQPISLEIINESHLHKGHINSPGTGESHFRITIVSSEFENKSRLERHRMVNEVLSEEIAGPVHALAIKASAP